MPHEGPCRIGSWNHARTRTAARATRSGCPTCSRSHFVGGVERSETHQPSTILPAAAVPQWDCRESPANSGAMTPEQFIEKWSRSDRTERQAAQEHFIDLCHVLGEPTPNEAADPDGYTFEKGVSKIDGTGGF